MISPVRVADVLYVKRDPDVGDVEIKASFEDYIIQTARAGETDALTCYPLFLSSCNWYGHNVLMAAALARRGETLASLLAIFKTQTIFSKILNAKDNTGRAPIHYAAISEGKEGRYAADSTCMKHLLRADAAINLRDSAGSTALHIASRNGFPNIVQALISHPFCDLDARVEGRTALQIAEYIRGHIPSTDESAVRCFKKVINLLLNAKKKAKPGRIRRESAGITMPH